VLNNLPDGRSFGRRIRSGCLILLNTALLPVIFPGGMKNRPFADTKYFTMNYTTLVSGLQEKKKRGGKSFLPVA